MQQNQNKESNVVTETPVHKWRELTRGDNFVTQAMTAGFGAIVRTTIFEPNELLVNPPVISDSSDYVPNVVLREVFDEGSLNDPDPQMVWVLWPHHPGKPQ